MLKRSLVELDFAALPWPNADQSPRERRFARSAWADDPDSLAASQLERNVTKDLLLRIWSPNIELFNNERFGRRWKNQRLRIRRQKFQQLIQPRTRLPRGDEALPVRDRDFHRAE